MKNVISLKVRILGRHCLLTLLYVHFIKHDIQGCIFKMCRNFTYEVVGQRRKLKQF
jgi:hypothetical protein